MDAFAWPAVVVLLGITALVIVRRPLRRFVSKATSLQLWGARVEATATQQLPASKTDTSHDLMKAFDNALLVANEKEIDADLKRRGLDGKVSAIPVLVRHLAATQIAVHFERVYSVIWGSQLAILQHLNTLGNAGAQLESLRPFYQQASVSYPPLYDGYPFESYMAFLTSHMLIEIKGGSVFITLVGREFLKWLIDEGRGVKGG